MAKAKAAVRSAADCTRPNVSRQSCRRRRTADMPRTVLRNTTAPKSSTPPRHNPHSTPFGPRPARTVPRKRHLPASAVSGRSSARPRLTENVFLRGKSVFPPRHARTSAGKDRTVHPLRLRLPLRPEADRSFGSGFVLRHRKHPINMNHGLSILFRAIPLLRPALCFCSGA